MILQSFKLTFLIVLLVNTDSFPLDTLKNNLDVHGIKELTESCVCAIEGCLVMPIRTRSFYKRLGISKPVGRCWCSESSLMLFNILRYEPGTDLTTLPVTVRIKDLHRTAPMHHHEIRRAHRRYSTVIGWTEELTYKHLAAKPMKELVNEDMGSLNLISLHNSEGFIHAFVVMCIEDSCILLQSNCLEWNHDTIQAILRTLHMTIEITSPDDPQPMTPVIPNDPYIRGSHHCDEKGGEWDCRPMTVSDLSSVRGKLLYYSLSAYLYDERLSNTISNFAIVPRVVIGTMDEIKSFLSTAQTPEMSMALFGLAGEFDRYKIWKAKAHESWLS